MGSTKIAFFVTLAVFLLLVEDIQSCHCPPISFQDSFCDSPFAIKGFVENGEEVWSSFGTRMYTRYTVQIEQVFRKPEDETKRTGNEMIISVPYESSMCGMTLTEGRHYFLTGFIYPSDREKYQVTGCELVQFYETLTPQQVDGISGGYGCSL
ncbi:metalloproteinase inhibitor 3-like [Mizuhopecten yessoensis]|uniref:metalloproteinase inhibitor 3-like n=1 Tax=Mizuhopecten yessoensis TaxID=6573 RepID=UPI000B458FCF|nr:metalloproteinase inhibitor 3-like [Mizuhopecten yessoensis]